MSPSPSPSPSKEPKEQTRESTLQDPHRKLTPLQRRRIREGKPFTNRPLNDTEKKMETTKDTQKLRAMENSVKERNKAGQPSATVRKKMESEKEDIVAREKERKKEYERRELAQQEAVLEEKRRLEKEKKKLLSLDEAASAEEARLKAQQSKERRAKADAMHAQLNGVEVDEEGEEQADGAPTAASRKAVPMSVEVQRLMEMADEAAMTEERQLRALLDCGTPDKLADVIRRLRADDPRLIKVTLRQNNISFQDAAKLAEALTHNTSCLSIDFRYNKVGDYGAKLIAEAIINCPSLGELRVTPNDVGEAGAQALREACEMCKFQAMSVSSSTLAMPEESLAPIMVRMR